jgi:hypothetical protein
MDERDLEPEQPVPRLHVNQLGPLGRKPDELISNVVYLEGHVVHPGAALREELPDRRVGPERCEQLDAAVANEHRRGLDPLVGHGLAVLELRAEESPVGVDCLVEILDRHTEVMDSSSCHAPMLSGRRANAAQTCHACSVRLRVLLVAVALTALLAGCGGSSSSTSTSSTAETTTSPTPYSPLPNGEAGKFPDTIVLDALAAAKASKGVHVVGSVTNGGKPLKLDLDLVTGEGGSGTVTSNGLTFEIVRIGAKAYFKGDAKFWSHFGGGAARSLPVGTWIEASAVTGDLAAFTPLTSVQQLFSAVLGSHGPLEKATGLVRANGKAAIAIIDSGLGSTLLVSANGPPYPLGVEEKGGGVVTFDHWNQPAPLTAPKNALELDTLKPK